ncbi:hypothetical protein HHI36_019222 [Cryptolaemus montrouzieri]|uniref:G patch domain-containing protein n=1 Tax=Cryptolaemus montrouzieri TaxID=559131 RepID=A0ABD2P2Z8_9CUCU
MSDSEEESFCFYGKPLDPYDENAFPKKRPITVEEQIATDSNGRRRFHGAFTGGFSAGFFNTVGSLEGWTPNEFKSSRSEKKKHVVQNPEDFMDEEDKGEFGFAPQTIRATKDFDTSKKRKKKVFSDGPIPGEPVLHTLLTTGNETVGYLLLKNIGIQEKIAARDDEISSNNKSKEIYPPPVIPKSFTGKYKVKRSRFEPIQKPESKNIDRKDINPIYRAELLGEEVNNASTPSRTQSLSRIPTQNIENVNTVKTKQEDSISNSNNLASSVSSNCLNSSLNASNVSDEKKTKFDADDLWNDRFVSAVQDDEATNILAPVKKYESEHYSKEMKGAAKMKMFGPLTRISENWQPCSLLCRRFNVPEPMSDKHSAPKGRTKTKNLIFEYQKHYEENLLSKPGLNLGTSIKDAETTSSQSDENKDEGSLLNQIKQEVINIEDNNSYVSETMIDGEINTKTIKQDNMDENVKKDEIIDITDRLNIEEKVDLFRAVFLSSSESEEEPEQEKEELKKKEEEDFQTRELELKSNVLGEELVLPKIKPVKGILSGLDFRSFQNKERSVNEEKEEAVETKKEVVAVIDSSIYGPKVPEKKVITEHPSIPQLNNCKNYESSSDEWVEKDSVENRLHTHLPTRNAVQSSHDSLLKYVISKCSAQMVQNNLREVKSACREISALPCNTSPFKSSCRLRRA